MLYCHCICAAIRLTLNLIGSHSTVCIRLWVEDQHRSFLSIPRLQPPINDESRMGALLPINKAGLLGQPCLLFALMHIVQDVTGRKLDACHDVHPGLAYLPTTFGHSVMMLNAIQSFVAHTEH